MMRTRLLEVLIALLIGCCFCAVPAFAQLRIQSFTVDTNTIVAYGAPGAVGTVTFAGNCGNCYAAAQSTQSPILSPPLLSTTGGVLGGYGNGPFSFTIFAHGVVSQPTQITFTLSLNGSSASQTITVLPPTLSLSCSPPSLIAYSNQNTQCKATLGAPVFPAGVTGPAWIRITASPGSGITIGGWIEVLNEQTEGTLPNISCSRTGNYTITATFGSTTSTNLPCTPHQLTLSVDHAYISPGHPGTLTGNVSPQYPTGTSNQLTVSVSPTSAASAGNISIPANATTGTSQ